MAKRAAATDKIMWSYHHHSESLPTIRKATQAMHSRLIVRGSVSAGRTRFISFSVAVQVDQTDYVYCKMAAWLKVVDLPPSPPPATGTYHPTL